MLSSFRYTSDKLANSLSMFSLFSADKELNPLMADKKLTHLFSQHTSGEKPFCMADAMLTESRFLGHFNDTVRSCAVT